MITNSLEWDLYRIKLKDKILDLPYNPDLRKLLRNIDGMIDALSRLEVEARRTKNSTRCDEQLQKINGAVDTLEKWIMMAELLR
jgi:hypothetical protein